MRTFDFAFLPVTASLALAACGGNVNTSSGGGGSGGGGSGGMVTGGGGESGGTTGSGGYIDNCADYKGLATAEEMAQSPYLDTESEILAIEASGKIVAPKDVYQRIHDDLASIRAADATVAGIFATPAWPADQLLVSFDATGTEEIGQHSYTAWDCANGLYGVTKNQEVGTGDVILTFGHLFDIEMLASEYAMFVHVLAAGPNHADGDGDDVCAAIGPDGLSYTYIFDHGTGDCPAGCTEHVYHGYETDGSSVTSLGSFTNNDPAPAWFTAECSHWL